MNIELSPEQTTAWDGLTTHDNEIKRVLFGGQAGGGKSFFISLWLIHGCLKYPGSRGYIGREVLKRLKETTLVTFLDVAKSMSVPIHYNPTNGHVDFENGSRIVLLDLADKPSDPNFDGLGSTEFTFGAIDEGVQVSQRVTDILLSRTRYKHDIFDIKPKQLITCNPSPGWIKDEIVVPSMEGTLKKNTIFVPASLDSNPNKSFVDTYKDTLNALTNEFDKARLLHGDWYAEPKTGGEFYKEFNEEHNTGVHSYNPDEPIHISFDFNVNPYMTATIHQFKDGDLRQVDELCLKHPNNTTRATCKTFSRRYTGHKGGLFIYGDPAGKQQDTRSEKGFNDFRIIEDELKLFHPSNRVDRSAPSIIMRGNFINELFAGRIEGCSFSIHSECENTIGDYNFVKESQDGKKVKQKVRDANTGVTYEKRGHTSDANDYLICRIFADEFKRFVSGNRVVSRTLSNSRRKQKY